MAHEHPEHGGRILLERSSLDDDQVIYQVTLFVDDAEHRGLAALGRADGAVTIEPDAWDTPPPAWLERHIRPLLRQLYGARRPGTEDPPGWPRRLLRWRAPKASKR